VDKQNVHYGVSALRSFNGFLEFHFAPLIVSVRDNDQCLTASLCYQFFAARNPNGVIESSFLASLSCGIPAAGDRRGKAHVRSV